MSRRIFSLLFIGMLIVVLAECGGGGGQPALPGGGDAAGTLTWDAPSLNTDGSTIADLAGYKIYYGTISGSGNYTASIDVGNATSIPFTTLSSLVPAPGLYYIAVTAYDTAGNESSYSNEISKSL